MAGLMCPMEQPAVVNTATPNISNASPPGVKSEKRGKGGGKRETREERRVREEERKGVNGWKTEESGRECVRENVRKCSSMG